MRPSKTLTEQELLFRDSAAHEDRSSIQPHLNSSTNADENVLSNKQQQFLSTIEQLDTDLTALFRDRLIVQRSLNRQLVSFQANKQRAAYRWYKYKEAFSAPLVDFLLSRYEVHTGILLDPFAGAGTALFTAADVGIDADGIELLPVGQEIIRTRLMLHDLSPEQFQRLRLWLNPSMWQHQSPTKTLSTLRITDGAYPERTRHQIEKYLSAITGEPEQVQTVLRFALLCILEGISYTRKDGQYLRWDYRSGRRQGAKQFNKGEIFDFESAVCEKLGEILNDLSSGSVLVDIFAKSKLRGNIRLFPGSCLDLLPKLASAAYDVIITSPPYCNRYDYTRTYALELALLGVDEQGISSLRQQMLSCTVENRAKDLAAMNAGWQVAIQAADDNQLLQAILGYLDWCRHESLLNNPGIARMVRGYFYEMACVIAECNRLLKPGSVLCMINDNVRYAGASISVDLILSSIAKRVGFSVENIMVLPNGKGNSSQQMGTHGREVLRKCIYVWRKDHCRTAVT